MSDVHPSISQGAAAPALRGMVSALAGGRRGNSNPRRPISRRRGRADRALREAGRGIAAQGPDDSGSASGPEPERGARPSGSDSGNAPEGGKSATPARTAPRPGTTARHRRRDLEAELIGLCAGPGNGPEWWGPCWEQGLRPDLSAERLFDALAAFHPDVRVLHGLGVAGTASTIDHVVIGTGGVVVAATETCAGRVRSDGVHLRVRGKDRSPAVDVALWQAEVVRATLEQRGIRGIAVHGVLHWEHLEGLGDKAICLRGVPLLSAGATVGLAAAGTAISPLTIERVAQALSPVPQMQ